MMDKNIGLDSNNEEYSKKVLNGYKRIALALVVVNTIYLFIFTLFNIKIMSAISIVSIIIYLTIYFKINEDRCVQCFRITSLEVMIHILIYGLAIGGGTRSSGFCIVLIVGIRTACYFYKRIKNRVLRSSRYVICASAFYIIFSITSGNSTPLYGDDNIVLKAILEVFNSIVVIVAVNYYIYITSKEILKYEDALNEKNELLYKMAYIDSLTMIYNRRGIQEKFNQFRDEKREYSIILCDIDNFKNINDKYGHECGDMILEKIANIIQKLVEGIGYAARWGGEEILILSENKYIDAYVLGEQIRKKIEDAAFSYEGEPISITITIGIGEVKDFSTREAILIADKNLYIGKRSGKNIVIR